MTNNQHRIYKITSALRESFNPAHLEVIDDSHLHVGHAGAKSGKGHFTIKIISKAFAGKTKIEQHRMIYHALEDLMESDIHALRIHSNFAQKPTL